MSDTARALLAFLSERKRKSLVTFWARNNKVKPKDFEEALRYLIAEHYVVEERHGGPDGIMYRRLTDDARLAAMVQHSDANDVKVEAAADVPENQRTWLPTAEVALRLQIHPTYVADMRNKKQLIARERTGAAGKLLGFEYRLDSVEAMQEQRKGKKPRKSTVERQRAQKLQVFTAGVDVHNFEEKMEPRIVPYDPEKSQIQELPQAPVEEKLPLDVKFRMTMSPTGIHLSLEYEGDVTLATDTREIVTRMLFEALNVSQLRAPVKWPNKAAGAT